MDPEQKTIVLIYLNTQKSRIFKQSKLYLLYKFKLYLLIKAFLFFISVHYVKF